MKSKLPLGVQRNVHGVVQPPKPQIKLGLGIRGRAVNSHSLIDQRRIDGVRYSFLDRLMGFVNQFLQRRIIEPTRWKGVNFNRSHYSRESIIQERKKLGKKS